MARLSVLPSPGRNHVLIVMERVESLGPRRFVLTAMVVVCAYNCVRSALVWYSKCNLPALLVVVLAR